MRIDHLALRTFDRISTANFFIEAFNYKIQAEFEIVFDEEKNDKALCLALEPPQKISKEMPFIIDSTYGEYHLAPEIFVSEGTEGSIVHNWCIENKGTAIHHIAYQVDSVEETMKLWQEKGWAEFTSEKPFSCDGLTQIFTKPKLGYVIEFITRKEFGFCSANVKSLMSSCLDKT